MWNLFCQIHSLITNQIAKWENTFYEISNFKNKLSNNYGILSKDKTCFTRLLNGEQIREKNKIDIFQEGAILINRNNNSNNSHLDGSYLITFNGTTRINNISYTNLENKILQYITTNHFKNLEISDYKKSNNSELIPNINILSPLSHYQLEKPNTEKEFSTELRERVSEIWEGQSYLPVNIALYPS